MLTEEPAIQKQILSIVFTMTNNPLLREDLSQEALLHLFNVERRKPARTRSWYLQSCRFHVADYLKQGRSMDSLKRQYLRCDTNRANPNSETEAGNPASPDNTYEEVSARDMHQQLLQHLSTRDQIILNLLVDGSSGREIAVALSISHTAIGKHRRQIACVATELGISR